MKPEILVLALGLGMTGALTVRAGTPRIEFEKTVCDFGTTSRTQSVKGSFVFRNVGDGVLELGELSTTCGCIVATAKPDRLRPGRKGEVTFTLSMPSVRSAIDRQIVVPSNDPQNRTVALTVKANFIPLFEIEPILLQLEARPGQTTNLAALVRRTDGKPLNLARIEPTKPWIKATKAQKPGATEARILIEASPEGSPRHFTEWVRLFVEGSDQPAVSAVLMGRVLGDLRLSPELLFWNLKRSTADTATQEQAILTRRLTITSTLPGHPLEVRNVTSTLKELQVELITREKGKAYDLVARLTSQPKTTVRGTVSFETNLPSQPNVQVPLTITILE